MPEESVVSPHNNSNSNSNISTIITTTTISIIITITIIIIIIVNIVITIIITIITSINNSITIIVIIIIIIIIIIIVAGVGIITIACGPREAESPLPTCSSQSTVFLLFSPFLISLPFLSRFLKFNDTFVTLQPQEAIDTATHGSVRGVRILHARFIHGTLQKPSSDYTPPPLAPPSLPSPPPHHYLPSLPFSLSPSFRISLLGIIFFSHSVLFHQHYMFTF
jgi:hypothetical protein